MRNTIILLISLLALAAQGINMTNYPQTNDFSAGEWFLLSSPSQATNFNLPGSYVAKAADLTTVSNSVAGLSAGSQTPILQDVDYATHFATNLSGICGPGGAFDPTTLEIVGTPSWWASADGTWGLGTPGQGVYGFPNNIVFQADNITFPPSLIFTQPTF